MTGTGRFFEALTSLDVEKAEEVGAGAAQTGDDAAGTAAARDDGAVEPADPAECAPETSVDTPDETAAEAVAGDGVGPAAGDGAEESIAQEAGEDAGAPAVPAVPAGRADEPEAERAPVPAGWLRSAVEAVLMVVDAPVTELELATACQCSAPEVEAALAELAAQYRGDGRGFELRHAGGGWRFWSSPVYAEVVERFVRDGQQAKLTQAALETLAVVAYRQPVTRSRVAAVRGVNVDGVMRTLLNRGLVEDAGTEEGSGATLYRTTGYFLDRLGIDSLDELPELAPFLPGMDALDDVEMPPT